MTRVVWIASSRHNAYGWLSRGLLLPQLFMDRSVTDVQSEAPDRLSVRLDRDPTVTGAGDTGVLLEVHVDDDQLRSTDGPATTAAGGIPATAVAGVLLPGRPAAREWSAREFRAFDPAAIPMQTDPERFLDAGTRFEPTAQPAVDPDGREELLLRESVLGGLTAASLDVEPRPTDAALPLLLAGAAGLLSGDAVDRGLLTGALTVMHRGPSGPAPAALTLLGELEQWCARENLQTGRGLVQALSAWLDQLQSGDVAFEGFPAAGGPRLPRALLLFLLRPLPEESASWAAGVTVEEGVLRLAVLLSGLWSRYAGLPRSMRGGPSQAGLLRWAADAVRLNPGGYTGTP